MKQHLVGQHHQLWKTHRDHVGQNQKSIPLYHSTTVVCVYLRRWNSQTGGVIRTSVHLSALPEQLLDVLDRSQDGVSHVLQRRCFVEGTHGLCRATPFFCAFLVKFLACKGDKTHER